MNELAKQNLKRITDETLVPIGFLFAAIGVCFYMVFSYTENKTMIISEVKSIAMNDSRQDQAIDNQRKEMMDYVKNQTILFTEIRDRLTRLEATKNK